LIPGPMRLEKKRAEKQLPWTEKRGKEDKNNETKRIWGKRRPGREKLGNCNYGNKEGWVK